MPDLLVHALSRYDDRPAVFVDGTTITYRGYREAISTWAQVYRAVGLGPGDGISVLSRNKPEVLFATGASMMTGCRGTPLHPLGSADDHAYVLENAEIDTLVFDPALEEHVAAVAERAPRLRRLLSLGPSRLGEDLIALAAQYTPGPLEPPKVDSESLSSMSFTGGTTGRPKGVLSTYRGGAELTRIQMAEWQWPDDIRFLIAAPLSHAAAAFTIPVLMRGGSFVVLPGFTPGGWLEAVEKHRITATMIVPAMLYAILDHPDLATTDTSSLDTIFYGASAASPARLQQAIDRFGPVFFQFYGQNEAPMTITVLRKEEHTPDKLATCGRPVPWVRAALLDENCEPVPRGEPGEICVQGPLVMAGYHDLPEQTEEAFRGGWLHTGDIAREDDDGYWTIVDRTKDMIVSGGFNVFPREIEDVLTTHPDVSAAAVIGVPDEKWGEAVKAVVVPRPGATIDDAVQQELIALVREAKGPIHAPKSVDVAESLPLTPVGKSDKKALRAQYWAGAARLVN
ncbi:AMP-binding protein [Cryptosporangium sp. NPDC051539]|uniref:AMP-binding protein n=1 Tax=Cryptosporangium sp. NPDC051539 TaxID=3363962 RepID=UPI0037A1FCD0